MFVVFAVTAVILAAAYAAVNICYKKSKRQDYDFITKPQKSLLAFAHVIICICIGGMVILSVVGIFEQDNVMFAPYAMILFFAVLGFLLLLDLYFSYEAMIGDEVFVYRFSKLKKFNVRDIW